MQIDNQANNKRIAKNTLFLYFRMILIMLVQFYTVRVTLRCLGVTDYGIFNLVAGVTNIFTFLTHTMTSASQRFFAYDIGKGDTRQLRITFDTMVIVFIILSVISVFLLEIIGNWLIAYKLVIPADRLFAAKIVFQISLIILILTFITLPFNSLIIAHEEMKTFAYVSVLDAVMKLLVVYILVVSNSDKLITYSILYLAVQLTISSIYIFHCFKKYKECDKEISFDISVTKKIIPYMSWNLIGGVSWMLCSQGLTILINVFFGPIANAAKAIADKIDSSVNAFMNNFMMAAQPQIVKTYANGERDAMHSLIYLSSRISFYLIMSLTLPIIFNADSILFLWLGNVDDLTIRMVQTLLAFSMISALENPINQAIRATGKIRDYQVYTALITFGVLPLSYLFFIMKFPPYFGYIALIIVYSIALFARLYFLKNQIGISYRDYFQNVIIRQIICLLLSITISYTLLLNIPFNNIWLILTRVFLVLITCLSAIMLVGLKRMEKQKIIAWIKERNR